MRRSKIGWTDFSGGNLNPTIGCTPVDRGCDHCYARRLYDRWGKDFSKVTTYPEKLERLKTQVFPQDGNRRGPGKRPMCFLVDMGDLFHSEVSTEFVWRAFTVMMEREDIIWQITTKRPGRMSMEMWSYQEFVGMIKRHLWFGVSVEDQYTADERILDLIQCPSGTRWVSIEPMLGPVDLRRWLRHLDWTVIGGESGPKHRPLKIEWVEDVYKQCVSAGVPCYIKQDSAFYPGKPLLIDGREIHEWPEVP